MKAYFPPAPRAALVFALVALAPLFTRSASADLVRRAPSSVTSAADSSSDEMSDMRKANKSAVRNAAKGEAHQDVHDDIVLDVGSDDYYIAPSVDREPANEVSVPMETEDLKEAMGEPMAEAAKRSVRAMNHPSHE